MKILGLIGGISWVSTIDYYRMINQGINKKFSAQKLEKVGLLGTKFTMERPFFRDKLSSRDIEVIIPDDNEREFIHYTIFEELGRSIFKAETKQFYLDVMQKLLGQGAQGIIMGCTEIPLLISPDDIDIALFDTAQIHSDAAVEFALSD